MNHTNHTRISGFSLKDVIFWSDVFSTTLSLTANGILLFLIQKKTPEELKPYAKIMRQNSLVDTFFTIVIGITFLELEVVEGYYILFQQSMFKHIPHPWNGWLLVLERKLSNFEFYAVYLVTGTLSAFVAFGIYVSCFPAIEPELQLKYQHALGDFWLDEHGNYPIVIASELRNIRLALTVLLAISLVIGTYGCVGFFCMKTLKHLNLNYAKMTERNRKLQRHLTITLIAQAVAPCLLAVLPVSMILTCMLANISAPHLGLVLITTVSWVAVTNPLFVIFLIGPYREVVFGLFGNAFYTIFPRKRRAYVVPSTGIGLTIASAAKTEMRTNSTVHTRETNVTSGTNA